MAVDQDSPDGGSANLFSDTNLQENDKNVDQGCPLRPPKSTTDRVYLHYSTMSISHLCFTVIPSVFDKWS